MPFYLWRLGVALRMLVKVRIKSKKLRKFQIYEFKRRYSSVVYKNLFYYLRNNIPLYWITP